MLSFELSAIDIILSIAVIVLLLLYTTKLSIKFPERKSFLKPVTKTSKLTEQITSTTIKSGYAECPRGFGNIKHIHEDNSVSERCLGCYKIMECYDEKQ